MLSREEEKQNVIKWLEHPHELGCKPNKIEFTNEFTDEDGIQCMIFKYKKSILSPWLLAIASDSGIFSRMEKYDQKTEVEDAKVLIAFLKEFWKNQANAEEEKAERKKNAETFHGFILIEEEKWEVDLFESNFEKEWGIALKEEPDDASEEKKEEHDKVRIYMVDSMRVILGFMDMPVPNEEAEYNARMNYMWKDGVEEVKKHKAHIILSILGGDNVFARGNLFTKVATTLCRMENTLGFYANGVVYEPKMYAAFSDMMKDGTMPIFNMVWFGLGRDEDGVCAYTRGMRQFGKDEMEILGSKQLPSELRDFLINIAGYVLEGDVLLHDGETIGVSNEQRCKITKSPGVFMEGESLKIEW